jgi:DNA-binding NtrC family response regulator
MSGRILIVDDEEIVVRSCLRILRDGGYSIDDARDGLTALGMVNDNEYDVLILDIMMPKMDGIEVLRRVKEARPEIDVIMITGLHDIETAVRAMKFGALDYLPKPFEPEELKMLVSRTFDRRARLQGTMQQEIDSGTSYHFENIIGSSPEMQRVYRLRKRDRQGIDSACDPLQQPAQRPALRSGRLHIPQREPARKRIVRAREGLVHRRRVEQERSVRNG